MHSLSHNIEVNASYDWVFEKCRDVTQWHLFMPAVRRARFIEASVDFDVVEVTAEANNDIWTWRSARRLNQAKGYISFERIAPMPPLVSMKGSWQFAPTKDGQVMVKLLHEFSTLPGNLEFENFLLSSIRQNATRDLAALAALAKTQISSNT